MANIINQNVRGLRSFISSDWIWLKTCFQSPEIRNPAVTKFLTSKVTLKLFERHQSKGKDLDQVVEHI